MSSKKISLQIVGMHCTSCAMNIDGELEDTTGVNQSNTNYARQKTEVEYDPSKITPEKIIEIIKQVGYSVQTAPN